MRHRNGVDIASTLHAFDDETSEHILLEGDDRADPAASATLTEQSRTELRDGLRGTATTLVFYAEGFLKLEETRRGRKVASHRLDLRYLDSVPTIERRLAMRTLYAALGLAAVTAAAALAAVAGVLEAIALPVFMAGIPATLGATLAFVYLSHEKVAFVTLHGRAPVLTLTAGLGCIRRCRAVLPALSRAIEDAADDVADDDTKAYLRREMREHYRLRGDGVLSDDVCSDSTGRILAQFDVDF